MTRALSCSVALGVTLNIVETGCLAMQLFIAFKHATIYVELSELNKSQGECRCLSDSFCYSLNFNLWNLIFDLDTHLGLILF